MLQQELHIYRGTGETVTAMSVGPLGPFTSFGLCARLGKERVQFTGFLGAFQRLGVTPDGTRLQQVTDARGFVRGADRTVEVEVVEQMGRTPRLDKRIRTNAHGLRCATDARWCQRRQVTSYPASAAPRAAATAPPARSANWWSAPAARNCP